MSKADKKHKAVVICGPTGIGKTSVAIKLAKHLGFSLEKQTELGSAGLLHDVGTVAIPDEVIYKQKKLNQNKIKRKNGLQTMRAN